MIPRRSFAFTVAAGLAVSGPAFAADGHHEAKADSSATVDIKSDGTIVMHSRNAELIPYVVYNGERHLPRLATVTTDVTRRTDAEGDDPSSTVSVTGRRSVRRHAEASIVVFRSGLGGQNFR